MGMAIAFESRRKGVLWICYALSADATGTRIKPWALLSLSTISSKFAPFFLFSFWKMSNCWERQSKSPIASCLQPSRDFSSSLSLFYSREIDLPLRKACRIRPSCFWIEVTNFFCWPNLTSLKIRINSKDSAKIVRTKYRRRICRGRSRTIAVRPSGRWRTASKFSEFKILSWKIQQVSACPPTPSGSIVSTSRQATISTLSKKMFSASKFWKRLASLWRRIARVRIARSFCVGSSYPLNFLWIRRSTWNSMSKNH
jgi:hypothetical protein